MSSKCLITLILFLALCQNGYSNKLHGQIYLRAKPGETQAYIVGGSPTQIENYPYQLYLLDGYYFICGASIISNKHALTAAHCTDGRSASTLSVGAGSTRLGGGTRIKVRKINQHPSYNSRSFDYDVSVLELASQLSFGSRIQPIRLATSVPPEGSIATVTGWGATSEGGSISSTLMAVQVPIISNYDCRRVYYITPQMICAGYDKGGKDSCQGDSGGPMAVDNTLIGIVSAGYGCARAGYPGVYANVAALNSWISQFI